ncbi:MAG: hypothetical protein U1A27_11170 [Phycisphaerae bacterium]
MHALRRTLPGLIAALSLAGCHELNPRTVPLPADGQELPIRTCVFRAQSHEDRPMRLVIRDAATLARVPLIEIPVDFNEEMLLVVTLGRCLSDQYRIDIRRVWRDGGVLKVDYDVVAPPDDAPLVLASPFCIAVVPRCDLNVEGFSSQVPGRSRQPLPRALQERRDVPGRSR